MARGRPARAGPDLPPGPPPPTAPGGVVRVLREAMGQAGAEGSAQQSAGLAQRTERDARQRLEWGQRMGTAVDDLQRVAGQLQRVSAGIWWDRLKEWLSAALIGLGLIFAAALAYQWAKEPKIEQRLYGCTARWDAKTGKCKGDWVPLQARE